MHMFYMQNSSKTTQKRMKPVSGIDFQLVFRALLDIWSNIFPHRTFKKLYKNLLKLSFFFHRSFNLPRVAQQLERLMGSR